MHVGLVDTSSLAFLSIGTSAMAKSSFVHIIFQKHGLSRPHGWNLMILISDSESPQNLNPGNI